MIKWLLSNNDHKEFFLYTVAIQSSSNKKYPKNYLWIKNNKWKISFLKIDFSEAPVYLTGDNNKLPAEEAVPYFLGSVYDLERVQNLIGYFINGIKENLRKHLAKEESSKLEELSKLEKELLVQ